MFAGAVSGSIPGLCLHPSVMPASGTRPGLDCGYSLLFTPQRSLGGTNDQEVVVNLSPLPYAIHHVPSFV